MTTDNLTIGWQIRVRGLVQGVGFRPTVWRLAQQLQLSGHVLNDGDGVLIEIWGSQTLLERFTESLQTHCPPLARIDSLQQQCLSGRPATTFQIIASQISHIQTAIAADSATCSECTADINDANNRRYRYPFTNCTNCGPRLSIIHSIPYDRIHTSMADFKQCSKCQSEYDNPANRRFHAQPNACPDCGPKLWLEPPISPNTDMDILAQAQQLLQQGSILAIKGIGGFHLACDAHNHQAVARLRANKQRDAKPFALMAANLDIIRQYCILNPAEIALLQSPAAPIVLLARQASCQLPESIAPNQNTLGLMLPYTPLHHLLLQGFPYPIVMTSANLSNQPQCIDNAEARTQLEGLADFYLMHDRAILQRLDDSVVRIIKQRKQTLRRARGYAPLALSLPDGFKHPQTVLAFGGELKNTFCLIKNAQAILSQHIGDLENINTLLDYEKNLALYSHLFNHQPSLLAVDAHPDYLSSQLGRETAEYKALPLINVPHHHAHLAACLADNAWPLEGSQVLGIVLDGLGMGQDGTLWGGEFLLADYHSCERLASFKAVALIGAAQAMREPWRNSYAHLLAAFSWQQLQADYQGLELLQFFEQKPIATLNAMLNKQINSPLASSCGRLFDAVAAAIGLCREKNHYEGQAAIELEALLTPEHLWAEKEHAYHFHIDHAKPKLIPRLDPQPMWQALLNDLQSRQTQAVIAARFHLGLANGLVQMVNYLNHHHPQYSIKTIALSGGVFQNRQLFELVSQELEAAHYTVLCHHEIPANDGGLALGQAVIALAQTLKEKPLCA